MDLRSMIERCQSCGQIIRRNQGGRPVDPESKRQRVLSYLDNVPTATTKQIALAIREKPEDLYSTISELRREGKLVEFGKSSREKIWRIDD